MSETDPVSVTVEIVNNFSDDIETLKKELKSIERDIGVNLDIDDNGDIDWAKLQLEDLEDVINALLKIKTSGFEQALAKKELLGKDTKSTHKIESDFAGNLTKSGFEQASFKDLSELGIVPDDGVEIPVDKVTSADSQLEFDLGESTLNHMGFEGVTGKAEVETDLPDTDGGLFPDGITNPFGDKDGSFGFSKSLKSMIPTVRTWMTLIAVLLPMVIALAAAVGGLVTALGAVALAGAAAFAFGAWGISDFQQRIQQLQDDLSSLFEPVKQAFAPFVKGFLSSMPRRMQPLVDAFQELTVFEGTIDRAFDGLIGWISQAISATSNFRQEINTILSTIGASFGESIIDFLGWLLEETANNKQEFLELASVLKDVVAAVYYVSKALSFAASNFGFLFEWLREVTELLSNKWVVAVLSGVAAIALMAATMKGLILAVGLFNQGLIATALNGLTMYIAKAAAAIGVSNAFAASLGIIAAKVMVIVGALVILANILDAIFPGFGDLPGMDLIPGVDGTDSGSSSPGGGFGGPSSPRGAGGGNTYITVEGDTDKDSLNKLNDKLDSSWKTYSSRAEEREM